MSIERRKLIEDLKQFSVRTGERIYFGLGAEK